ncbi:MAG TPA: hypothetical protein VI790_04315 [Candidatus Nanoarchaeia archaeon]|nr:hypothetical protein [Candidatus Nanoarchaeia archaeon]
MSCDFIKSSDSLADCLLSECEYMEITPVSFDSLDDFNSAFSEFTELYSSIYATPKGGFINFNKLFDLFCNIYTLHYKSLEDNIKAPFFDLDSGEFMADLLPEGHSIESYVNRNTFSTFLNRFHDYFTERVKQSDGSYFVSYSYDKRSLQGFIDDVTSHLNPTKAHFSIKVGIDIN